LKASLEKGLICWDRADILICIGYYCDQDLVVTSEVMNKNYEFPQIEIKMIPK